MCFTQKLLKQFKTLSLETLNVEKWKLHIYADYIELVAIISKCETTVSDIFDRMHNIGLLSFTDEETQSEDDDLGSRKPENEDEEKNRIINLFSLCNLRKQLFNSMYPFKIRNKTIIIKKRLNELQKIYIFLLISSNLNFFNILKTELTSEFEMVAYNALQEYLPTKAIVKRFGYESEYSGSIKEKIKSLAIDLGVRINERYINPLRDTSGDRGLDIVGWIPFIDKTPNMCIYFAQCTCKKAWHEKQLEASRYPEKYLNLMGGVAIQTLFIPYSLNKEESSFYQEDEIIHSLMFDRLRIMENLENVNFFKNLRSREIVERLLQYEEDII